MMVENFFGTKYDYWKSCFAVRPMQSIDDIFGKVFKSYNLLLYDKGNWEKMWMWKMWCFKVENFNFEITFLSDGL